MEYELRELLEEQYELLRTLPKGTEEYKSVQKNIEILKAVYFEDYKCRMQEEEMTDRLRRKDQEETSSNKWYKKILPKPDTVVNASAMILLTAMLIKYDKDGGIFPQKFTIFKNLVRIV